MSLGARPALLLLAFLAAGSARAQEWRVYTFKDAGFAAQFPMAPTTSAGDFAVPVGVSTTEPVPSTTYWVKQGAVRYSVVVADLSKAKVDAAHLVDQTAMNLRREGDVQLDEEISLGGGGCGRHLGLQAADGGHTFLAIFAPSDKQRLYILRASVPAVDLATADADALLFQQSLDFPADPAPTTAPAEASGWTDYSYIGTVGFAVRLPAAPLVQKAHYLTADGSMLPATQYVARDGQALYRVTVVDLWKTAADREDAVDAAVNVLHRYGEVRSERFEGIQFGQCGRDLTLAEPEGRQASVGVYFPTSQHKLFIVEAEVPQAELKARADDVALFRKSFRLDKYPDNTP